MILLAASAYLRTRYRSVQFWIDEAISTGIASHPLGAIPGLLRHDGSPPLFYFLLHFWMQAFGATEAIRMPPDPKGRYMHIHLYINGSSVMLSDPFEDHGHPWVPPAGFSLTLEVDDADFWAQRAIKAGPTETSPVQDMFWGARYGQVTDPFGVLWAFNQPKK